jgi:hypothetical protein
MQHDALTCVSGQSVSFESELDSGLKACRTAVPLFLCCRAVVLTVCDTCCLAKYIFYKTVASLPSFLPQDCTS